MKSAIQLLALSVFVLVSLRVFATELCVRSELEQLNADINRQNVTDAIERMKRLHSEYPNRREPVLLLAMAYQADNNLYWSFNILHEWLRDHPDDCEALSHVAWLHVNLGQLDMARSVLEAPTCRSSAAWESRFHLLEQYILHLEGEDTQVKTFVTPTGPDERRLWHYLWQLEKPGRVPPLKMNMALQMGITTNGEAGAPTDSHGTGTRSGTGHLLLRTELTLPTGRFIRPSLTVATRFNGFSAVPIQKYSLVDFSYSPGLILGRQQILRISYRGNLLLMNWPGQEIFHETHRLELTFESTSGHLVFAGFGKRIFKQNGRTRWELDGGYGISKILNSFTTLLAAISVRYHNAIGDAYDMASIGIVTAARFGLPARFAFRTGLSESMDRFFRSSGEAGRLAFGFWAENPDTEIKREDITVSHFDEILMPPIGRIQWGLRYEFNWRNSSADLTTGEFNYDYREHRFMLVFNATATANPLAPRIHRTKNYIPLNYGTGASDSGAESGTNEIIDLLQSDETVRAASSCVD